MNTLSYIDGEARYVAALLAAAACDSLHDAAAARFRAAIRPGAMLRARQHWGLDEFDELLRPGRVAELVAIGPAPDPAARAAIADLDREWPEISASQAAGLERLLDGWGLVARDSDGLAIHPSLLAAVCIMHGIEGELSWIAGHVPSHPASHVRLVASEAARAVAAGATGEQRRGWLLTAPAQASPTFLRELARLCLAEHSSEHTHTDVEATAAKVRGALFHAIDGGGQVAPGLVEWLVDVPDEALQLRSARPLLLLSRADELLRAAFGHHGSNPTIGAAFVDLVIGDAAGRDVLVEALRVVGADDVVALSVVARRSPAMSCRELLDALMPAAVPTAYSALVERPSGGSVSWRGLLDAASVPALSTELTRLLEGGELWGEFDAPGEGTLPRFWADVLVVAGLYTEQWAEKLGEFVERRDLPDVAAEAGDVVGRYCSELAGAEQRLDPERSPMSAYSHGLHDGVSEAYGDVWSPGDPFSARRRGDNTES